MISDALKDDNKALGKREAQLEQMKRELSNLPSKRDLAWREIQNGTRPEWVAIKYGFPVEQMQQASDEHKRREEMKRERINAARGNR